MEEDLKYDDLTIFEKHWYYYLYKRSIYTLDSVILPKLTENIRVWELGKLYEVIYEDDGGFGLILLDEATKERLEYQTLVYKIDINYSRKFDKKKRYFVLDSPTDKELGRIRKASDFEVTRSKSKIIKALDYTEGTVGELIHQVYKYNHPEAFSNDPFSKLSFLMNIFTRTLDGNDYQFVEVRNDEENIQIDWDEIPLEKRKELFEMPIDDDIIKVNDFLNVKVIRVKFSLKDYLPTKE